MSWAEPSGGRGASAVDWSRRRFLSTLAGAGALAVVPLRAAARGGSFPAVPIGVQLYTVRTLMADDPAGTLRALAEIGYREVELAGLYGMSAAEMRGLLDAAGLRAASSHHSLGEVRGDWSRVLADARTLGQDQVVVPSLPTSERGPEALARIAGEFDRAGRAAREAGLRFGYHNHDWEMRPGPDGVAPIEILLGRTDPELVDWQMDIYWVAHGGRDPLQMLDRYAGRVRSVHVKDRAPDGRMVDVGDGVLDFPAILSRAETLGRRHQFVEHDRPADPLESVRRSYAALKEMVGAA